MRPLLYLFIYAPRIFADDAQRHNRDAEQEEVHGKQSKYTVGF